MRAAARQASRQIAAQARGEVAQCAEDDESDLIDDEAEEEDGDSNSDLEEEAYHSDRGGTDTIHSLFPLDCNSSRGPSVTSPSRPSTSPLRSGRPVMSAPKGSTGIARQTVRDGIVQQWEPSRSNGANSKNTSSRVPLTPPMNDQDRKALRHRELEQKIMQQVEENGIERPKGYTVSFHYNRRVENMHFGRTHPMKPWRLTLTKHLVMGYGLQYAMDNYDALPASQETVAAFHDPEYVEFLSKVSPQTFPELCRIFESRTPIGYPGEPVTLGPFNLSTSPGADCPVFDGMSEYLFLYTGATMEAVSKLINCQSDIAINWSGGLHHAHKSEASGFCYINDIVLAILELLKCYQRVLYIDIDVHHGDGVEEAFASSDRVMTLSYHRFGKVQETPHVEGHLFFPGTGGLTDNGSKGTMGHHFALNVPIPSGIDDDQFLYLFEQVTGRTLETFRPQAIVLQCGADSLGGDRLGQFNLNIRAHGECLGFVKKYGVPLLVLGGGGYTARNVARAWCHETALTVGATLNEDLPMHIVPRPQAFAGRTHGDGKLYPELGGYHKNGIQQKDIHELIEHCHEELRYVKHAPSVVMERLPSRAVMEAARRQVDEELEADKAVEGARGERERRRKERNPGGRGELR